jgi:hypothetical protein
VLPRAAQHEWKAVAKKLMSAGDAFCVGEHHF